MPAWTTRLGALRGNPLDGAERTSLVALASPDRPTLYAFWATYCPPCLEEMPIFQMLHEAGHRVVGVSLDAGEREAVVALLKNRGASYPNVVLDETSMKAAGLALPAGVPFTLVTGAAGEVNTAFVGKITQAQVEGALARAAPKR